MRILLPLLCGFFIGSAVSDAEQPAPIAATLTGPVTAGKGQPFGALTAKDLAASQYRADACMKSAAPYCIDVTSSHLTIRVQLKRPAARGRRTKGGIRLAGD